MGDIIFSLPIIKELGGGRLELEIGVVENDEPRLTSAGYAFVKPLLEYQTYISSVAIYEGGHIDIDLDLFRSVIPWSGCNLVDANYIAHGHEIDGENHTRPWLEAPSIFDNMSKHVVISRTRRHLGEEERENEFYQNLVKQGLSGSGLFIGFSDEHELFQSQFNVTIEHREFRNSLEIAMIVKNSLLWIGNENFIGAIAEGLKVTTVREIRNTDGPEQMYCAFRRPNLFYI